MAMGAQIQGVVVAWQMYAVTHDPLALGMVGLAEAAPFIACALYAGHVADIRDRRRITLAALAILSSARWRWPWPARFFSPRAPGGWIRWAIYAVIVVCGAARSFLLPARNALGGRSGPRPLFPSAVAWRTGIWQVAAVTGRHGRDPLRLGRRDVVVRHCRGADGDVLVHGGAASARAGPPAGRAGGVARWPVSAPGWRS